MEGESKGMHRVVAERARLPKVEAADFLISGESWESCSRPVRRDRESPATAPSRTSASSRDSSARAPKAGY